MANRTFYGAIGVIVRMACKENGAVFPIDSATAKQIKFKKPSGATATEDADFTTDGTDGSMQYVMQSGDLDETGTWYAQGLLTFGANYYPTDPISFEVGPVL